LNGNTHAVFGKRTELYIFMYIKSARIINQFSNNQLINSSVCKDIFNYFKLQSSFFMIFLVSVLNDKTETLY